MKKTIFIAALIFFLLAADSLLPGKFEYSADRGIRATPPFFRLHILANSNGQADQKTKLAVRDHILNKLYQEFRGLKKYEDAILYTEKNLAVIEDSINQYLKENNSAYHAACTVRREIFRPAFYGYFALPAGEYHALKVTLGEGCGENWWCVLYPPLCFYELNGDKALRVFSPAGIRAPGYTSPKKVSGGEESLFSKLGRKTYLEGILKIWITQ